MKARRSGLLPTLFLSLLAVSCETASEPSALSLTEGDEIVAAIDVDTPATRTSVSDLNVLWSEGDLLSVFPKTASNDKYVLKSGAGESFGVFTKSLARPAGQALPGYTAVYPYEENVSVSPDGTVSMTFPAVQTYAEDSFGPGANPMVAWSQDTRLSFFNVGAFLILPLKGNAWISSIEVTALGSETLAGPIEVAPGKEGPVTAFPEGAEGSDKVTLLCNEPVRLDEEEGTPFWVVVPPVTLDGGFKVTVTCENGTVIEQSYTKETAFERNHVFRMAPLEVIVEKTSLDYVLEDYRTLAAAYPNAKDHFVEARFILNDIIATTPAGQIKAESVATYCYVWDKGHSEICVLERDLNTGETQMYQYFADSPWLGDIFIPESVMKTLRFSVNDAIRNAKNDPDAVDSDGLDTRYITLRKPLWPVWDNPQYVVGGSASRGSHVFVDALNGTVSVKEGSTGGGGSSLDYLIEDYNIIRDMYWIEQILGFPLEIRGFITEARYVLNKPMDACQSSELYAKEVTYVFRVPAGEESPANYEIRGTRDLTKGFASQIETEAETVPELWPATFYFAPEEIDELISLEDAIYVVKLGNVTDPDTDEVTLCKPAGKPVYVFRGEGTPSVAVDAISGEILTD